jgi:peptidoglycan/LPS O-acetylase OafA/YrhL
MRARGLDGLRGIAAVSVVVLHVWMFGHIVDPNRTDIVDRFVGELRLAVPLFFVLSGYLVARPWLRSGLRDEPLPPLRVYALRRAARILPGYWVCLAGSYALMRALDHPRAVQLSDLPTFLLFAENQSRTLHGELNPPLWTLAIEVSFYAVLPLIGIALWWALRRAGRGAALALIVLIGGAGIAWSGLAVHNDWDALTTTSLPSYLPLFACGLGAAVIAQGRTPSTAVRWTLLAAGITLVFLNGWWRSGGAGVTGYVVQDVVAGVGFALLCVAATSTPGHVLGSPPLRFMGAVSMGTYLWHMPVLYLLLAEGLMPSSATLAILAVIACSLAIGWLSWKLIEEPSMIFARRWEPAVAQVPAARPTAPALLGEYLLGEYQPSRVATHAHRRFDRRLERGALPPGQRDRRRAPRPQNAS